MSIERYHLGCPVWGFKAWAGSLYTHDARPADFLPQYARVFNAVEGNSTFYSVPEPATVSKWREESGTRFKFCFKLPRHITHDRALADARRETDQFLARMAPLGDRLGPFMIQLPASFGPAALPKLDRFLRELPADFDFACELRHPAFFGGTDAARRSRELLASHDCDRIVLDTRGLRAGPQNHPDVAAARHAKPDLPVETAVTGRHPIVRFIGHPIHATNDPFIARWAAELRRMIEAGLEPYFFAHCPNDLHAPALARKTHLALRHELEGVGDLPPFLGESHERATGQLSLL